MVKLEPKYKNEIYENEVIVKKSRFISKLYFISSKEEAEKIILDTKKEYFDAKHVVFAYRLDNTAKFTDDKEPQGTAGKPIYGILEKENLINVLIVVIRYFGGVLLGTGPLTRAYSLAAKEVINKCEFIKHVDYLKEKIECSYNEEENIKRKLQNENCIIESIDRFEKVTINFLRPLV